MSLLPRTRLEEISREVASNVEAIGIGDWMDDGANAEANAIVAASIEQQVAESRCPIWQRFMKLCGIGVQS